MTSIPMVFPEKFLTTIRNCFEERGVEWLERLPQILEETADRWSLTVLPPFPNLSFSYVTPVMCTDGTDAVLKVSVVHPEILTQIDALRIYGGRGSVRLLQAEREQGIFLLERLSPGTTLTTYANDQHDAKATSITAQVMRGLWCKAEPPHNFPTVDDWFKAIAEIRQTFDGGTGYLDTKLVEEAEALAPELLVSSAPYVLLHGDLHHDNILEGKEGWLSIDPQGVLGEPCYEVGAMLRNLWQDRHTISNPQELLTRRVHQLAEELEMDKVRIRNWAVAQAVLSAWWCHPEVNDVKEGMATAQLLANIRV